VLTVVFANQVHEKVVVLEQDDYSFLDLITNIWFSGPSARVTL
jgi:hypothetical protein